MSKYEDVVKQDTPRLIVKFRLDSEGRDQYEWGTAGSAIPLLHIIGAIIKTQNEMFDYAGWELEVREKTCPNQELVIAWLNNTFSWFMHRDTPMYGMLGMLNMIRATLEDTIKARQHAAQQMILAPKSVIEVVGK